MDNGYEIVKFVEDSFELEVSVSPKEDTVWLTQEQMAVLFNSTKQNISLHISNILNEAELDIRTVKDYLTVQQEGSRKVKRTIKIYNLDYYLPNSGIKFRMSNEVAFYNDFETRIGLGFSPDFYVENTATALNTVLNLLVKCNLTDEKTASFIKQQSNEIFIQ